MDVTACLVTRGNVDMQPIIDSLPSRWKVIVGDNSKIDNDRAVFGRYCAVADADTDVVYVQDDDCILPPWSLAGLAGGYKRGVLTANMPERFRAHYSDSCLVGFGAIFDRELPERAFSRMVDLPASFNRTCDVYFSALTDVHNWLDLPYEDREFAAGPDRMYRQTSHGSERGDALAHARSLR